MKRVIEIELGKCICKNCGYELFLNPIINFDKFIQEFKCSVCNKKFFIKEEEDENGKSTIEQIA